MSWLETSLFSSYSENYGSRNRPEKFWGVRETHPWREDFIEEPLIPLEKPHRASRHLCSYFLPRVQWAIEFEMELIPKERETLRFNI